MVSSWVVFFALVVFLVFLIVVTFRRWKTLSNFSKLFLATSIILITFFSGYLTMYAKVEDSEKAFNSLIEMQRVNPNLDYDSLSESERNELKKLLVVSDENSIDSKKYILNRILDRDKEIIRK